MNAGRRCCCSELHTDMNVLCELCLCCWDDLGKGGCDFGSCDVQLAVVFYSWLCDCDLRINARFEPAWLQGGRIECQPARGRVKRCGGALWHMWHTPPLPCTCCRLFVWTNTPLASSTQEKPPRAKA